MLCHQKCNKKWRRILSDREDGARNNAIKGVFPFHFFFPHKSLFLNEAQTNHFLGSIVLHLPLLCTVLLCSSFSIFSGCVDCTKPYYDVTSRQHCEKHHTTPSACSLPLHMPGSPPIPLLSPVKYKNNEIKQCPYQTDTVAQ